MRLLWQWQRERRRATRQHDDNGYRGCRGIDIFVNIFSVNPTTGAKTLLFGSSDQSSLIGSALGVGLGAGAGALIPAWHTIYVSDRATHPGR